MLPSTFAFDPRSRSTRKGCDGEEKRRKETDITPTLVPIYYNCFNPFQVKRFNPICLDYFRYTSTRKQTQTHEHVALQSVTNRKDVITKHNELTIFFLIFSIF